MSSDINRIVVAIQGVPVTRMEPTNGQVLTYVSVDGKWEPVTPPSSLPPSGPAGGDLGGTYPNPSVVDIHGATVPAAGSLTTGNVLQVSGSSTLSYGAVNLAGGSNYVSGVLPTGNQAAQSLSGDASGTTASVQVDITRGLKSATTTVGIASATAPSSGQVLTATSSTAATWQSPAAQTMNGDITGTTTSSVVSSISGTSPIVITPNILQWAAGATSPTLKQVDSISSNGNDLTIQAQNAGGSNHNGGNLVLGAGTKTGSGVSGNINLINPLQLDSSAGNFPTSGIIRSKGYASNQSLWKGIRSGGAELNIISQTTGDDLVIGDATASGWTTVQLVGDSAYVKATSGSLGFFSQSHSIFFNDYTSGNQGIVFSVFSTASGINNEIFFSGTNAGFIAVDPYTSASSGNGKDLVIQAGLAASGNNNSGNLNLHAGARTGSGTKGAVRLRINGTTGNSTTTETLIEATEIASGRRVVAINRDADLTTTEMPTNTGDLVTFIGDASTIPTANAVSGGILYSDSGALKWRGSSGTTTIMGPADLEGFAAADGNGHCPVCGTDFAHEWKNDEYGSLTICMACLAEELGDRPWIVRGK